ncbi:MAG: hypothetical protein AB7V62_16525 [Thermoleophilia bacterium]
MIGWLRRRAAAARDDTLKGLGGAIPLREGNVRSLGEQSRGKGQVRGNGHLAVTDDAIAFALMVPRRTLVIPRDRVTAVEEVRTHLGKWVGRPLVRVSFRREDGSPDAIAFDVGRDRAGWLEALGAG